MVAVRLGGHISDSPRSTSDRHFGRPLYSPTQIADHINTSTEKVFGPPRTNSIGLSFQLSTLKGRDG